MSAKASRASIKSKKSIRKLPKQPDPFYDPDKEVRPFCKFCTKPPTKPPLFNTLNLPFTTSTTSASWQGGTCCIHVREIDVSIDPPEQDASVLGAILFRRTRRRKFVYRTPSDFERVRERDYRITLKRTLEDDKWDRRLGFQKLKEKKRRLMNDVGPAWYQELSFKQMECMDVLGGTIVADMEEGVVARTQRLLARLGILPSPSNAQVLKAMTKCGSNPIIFLIYLYKFITEVEDECMEPDSPYSINDRLLLSGLTYLALPMTLFDLHFILPPPPEKNIPKPKAKPVVQRESFTSPYLDAQPICLYNGLVDEKIQRKRTQIARQGGLIKENVPETESEEELIEVTPLEPVDMSSSSSNNTVKRDSQRFTVEITKSALPYYGMMGKPSTFSVAMFENAMRQVGGGMLSETSSAFLPERDRKSAYLQNQLDTKISEGTKVRLENIQLQERNEWEEEKEISSAVPDEDNTPDRASEPTNVSEVRFQAFDTSVQVGPTIFEDEVLDNKQHPDTNKQRPDTKKRPDTNKPRSSKKKDNTVRKLVIPEIIITFAPDQPELDYDDYPYVFDESYEYQYDKKPEHTEESYDEVGEESSERDNEDDTPQKPICDCARARAARERRPKTVESDDGLHFTPSDILPCPIPTIPSLQAAFIGYWSGVRIPPGSFEFDHHTMSLLSLLYKTENTTSQFEVALEIMARRGNILAALPQVEKLPALRCWLRLYKGFKLTPDAKVKLMNKSFGLWGQKQQHPHKARLPGLKLKHPSKLDWNCKHWLMDKVNNMFQKYYSNVRKAQVEDAREYWITMCMEYFMNPAEFRNVYFAYLPSREADVLAVRPWDGRNSHRPNKRC